jgi:hypothetical protein
LLGLLRNRHHGKMKFSIFIDCGVHGLGASLFFDAKLVHAEYLTGLGGQPHPLMEPVARLDSFFQNLEGEPFHLGIEIPQIYQSNRQKGRQSDLVKLAIVAGECMRAACDAGCRTIITHQPAEWKGQVDPDVMIKRIQSKLSSEELECVTLPAKSVAHNVWDGIGIGLVHHRRMGK